MSQYQYNVDESHLPNLDLSNQLADLAEKARNQHLRQIEGKLKKLLPEHLRDGHDLAAATAWLQEHGVTMSIETNPIRTIRTVYINYPSYLD
jgi:hypothetical protein